MAQVTKRVPINAPMDRVWGVLADFGNAAMWAPNVKESHCTTDANMGVGAKRIMTTSSGDVVEEVIVEWVAGHHLTFEIPDGIRSIIQTVRETWEVEPSAGGCVVVVNQSCKVKPGLMSPLIDIVAKRALQKMLVENLAGLKYHVETGETVSHNTPGLPTRSVT